MSIAEPLILKEKETKEQKAARKSAKLAKKEAKATIAPSDSAKTSSSHPVPPATFAEPSTSILPGPLVPTKKSKKRKAVNDGPVPGAPHTATRATVDPADITKKDDGMNNKTEAEKLAESGLPEEDKRSKKKRRKAEKLGSMKTDPDTPVNEASPQAQHSDELSSEPPAASTSQPASTPELIPNPTDPTGPDPKSSKDDPLARKAAKQAKRDKKAKKRLEAAQAQSVEVEGSGSEEKDIEVVMADGSAGVEVNRAETAERPSQDGAQDAAVGKAVKRSGDPEDPLGDDRLSEKARECIQYAYTFKASISTWKFSKPKQNGLLKKVYDGEEVPEEYVELVLAYLKTIQGNGKKHIIEEATKIQAAGEASITTTAESETTTNDGVPEVTVSDTAIPDGTKAEVPAEPVDQAERGKTIARAERARRVLAALRDKIDG